MGPGADIDPNTGRCPEAAKPSDQAGISGVYRTPGFRAADWSVELKLTQTGSVVQARGRTYFMGSWRAWTGQGRVKGDWISIDYDMSAQRSLGWQDGRLELTVMEGGKGLTGFFRSRDGQWTAPLMVTRYGSPAGQPPKPGTGNTGQGQATGTGGHAVGAGAASTPSATAERVYFRDDFNDLSNWEGTAGRRMLKPGVVRISSTNHTTFQLKRQIPVENVVVEWRGAGHAHGFHGNLGPYLFNIGGWGNSGCGVRGPGAPFKRINKRNIYKRGAFQIWKIVVSGGRFAVYVDNRLIFEWKIPQHSPKSHGILNFTSYHGDLDIDWIKVYSAPAQGGNAAGTPAPIVGAPGTSTPTASAPAGTNLTLGGQAFQTSLGWNGFPHYAIDGNTSGNYNHKSVTHTLAEPGAWWMVDLGAVYNIGSVRLWNRTDCCGERLSNFQLLVSENAIASDDPRAARGRYVRVQLMGKNYLSLAEVEVFGGS